MKLRMLVLVPAVWVGFLPGSGASQTSTATIIVPVPNPRLEPELSSGLFGLRETVKGQPYSLSQTTTTVRTLADGTVMTSIRKERRMRDVEGRTRTEIKSEKEDRIHIDNVMLIDPVANRQVSLFAPTKIAHVSPLPKRPVMSPEQSARAAEMRAKAMAAMEARRSAATAPVIENLTPQTVAGVYAEGTRTTRTIPVGAEGNDREIRTVTEVWTSPDLKIVVGRTVDDPRFGKTTVVVTELERVDPPSELFQIPADYKIVEPRPLLLSPPLPQ